MRYNILFSLVSLLWFSSCSIKPEPIAYGHDGCAYCEMIIMDQRYGTELVSQKGKIFKFDSIECLVRYIREGDAEKNNYKYILLTPFNHPETLKDAHQCYILHSQGMPSPMGMFLTAFEDEATARKFQMENGGNVYSWNELVEKFDELI